MLLLLLLLSRFHPVQLRRQQPTRFPHPWDPQGKNTGEGCHFLLQCMEVKVKVKSLSRVPLLLTPWTAAYQAPLSMGFARQENWSGLPLPSLKVMLTSVQFSHSVVSDPLLPHELQHARPPCPSPTPGVHPDSRPLSW